MRKQSGFTVIEVIIAIVFLGIAAAVSLTQLTKLQNESHNKAKRTAINAIYYSLEEDFYKRNHYYPEKIDDNTLPTMDKTLLTDPAGKKLGDIASSYRYEPTNCHDQKCRSYTLRATLTDEAEFTKKSRHN